MKKTKGLKYYIFILFVSTVGMFLYLTANAIQNDGYQVELLYMLVVVPVTFTGFLYVFDKLFDFLLPNKYKKENQNKVDEYDQFLKRINILVDQTGEFSIEGFRKLRTSERFQKALRQSFAILKNGESEAVNFAFILKKFKKDTKEFLAINVVIDDVKKLQENSVKDYQK